MLNLYRRHLPTCSHHDAGRGYTKCSCPIWADGQIEGKRYLRSLKTRDWQRALRLAEHIERPNAERSDLIPCAQPGCSERVERGRCAKHQKYLAAAVEEFHAATTDLEHGTKRHNRTTPRFFVDKIGGDVAVHAIESGWIDSFRASRPINALTWTKELKFLRHFFRFCIERKWISDNPAAGVSMPRNVKPTDKEPYSPNDVVKILAACDVIGRQSYERLRARAMILLLRYTALRIGDVATLARDRVRNDEIYLRTMKNGKVVLLPVPAELRTALEFLPVPKNSKAGESKHFFWNGVGVDRTVIRSAEKTLHAVFKASGVAGAHPHRFRHTLATELLAAGASVEDVAAILGNSPDIVSKYYAKWSRGRQDPNHVADAGCL